MCKLKQNYIITQTKKKADSCATNFEGLGYKEINMV